MVIDTNILFSLFWKGSRVWKLVSSPDIDCISPKYALDELFKNREEIEAKAVISPEEFGTIVRAIEYFVEFVHPSAYLPKIKEAEGVSPHLKDVPFFALALAENAAICSEERLLKRQEHVRVFSKAETLRLFCID